MTKALDLEEVRKEVFKWIVGEPAYELGEFFDFTMEEVRQRLKSALQGLMEEIRLTDLEWVVYSDGSQKRMSEKERKEIIIEFIKKWFPDVVKDGE